jgi:hypothetical protein
MPYPQKRPIEMFYVTFVRALIKCVAVRLRIEPAGACRSSYLRLSDF